MTRKGEIVEIFSNASYHDNPESYLVGHMIFQEQLKQHGEFFRLSENFETIPATRISYSKKGNDILYSRSDSKKDPKV